MKPLLARAQQALLRRAARGALLLALDYDGTLAPIVDVPERARLRPRTRELLRLAARLYPTIVVSGRARRDLLPLLRGVRLARVIGNHGAEPAPRRRSALVARWRATLARRLPGIAGVWVEDKGLSLAVHYRSAASPARARGAIAAAARGLAGARLLGGRRVWNVMLAGAPNKGDAVAAELGRLGCAAVLYVGDDLTDEDVFAHPRAGRLGVRVGHHARSRARYYLRGQAEVDSLLARLVALRLGRERRGATRRATPRRGLGRQAPTRPDVRRRAGAAARHGRA